MVDRDWPQKILSSFLRFSRTYNLSRKLAFALSIAAIISGIATYLVLSGTGPFAGKSSKVLPWIYLDLAILLFLTIFIARRLVKLWAKRKQGLAGSRLHIHLVVLFGFVSVIPAILVAVFSALFFNVGIQAWFGEPVRKALNEAEGVAQGYVHEHMKAVGLDANAIVKDLRPQMPALVRKKKVLSRLLTDAADKHGLGEALIFDGANNVVARSYLTFALEFEKVPHHVFARARDGDIALVPGETRDRVRALIRLDPTTDTYLFVGKLLDPTVLKHLSQTESAIAEYNRLEEQKSGLQVTFILFFSVVALLLLLSAIWVGMTLANMLVRPISRLIFASDEVSKGNLSVQVDEDSDNAMDNELASLSRSFNRMTTQLQSQRQELIKANIQLDRRRQFTESVLSGVSAGVIGLDADRKINLPNQRASELLSEDLSQAKGTPVTSIIPEFGRVLNEAEKDPDNQLIRQITVSRRGLSRTLQVCVVVERDKKSRKGYILTFDDITALLSAQRKAAWSDVARKIAHEIKNPLTPIQLSAERLKRRYLEEIKTDPETFQTCIDTIVRQVQQIGKLVAEFSSFARMPVPSMKEENIVELASQAVFLQKQAYKNIKFTLSIPESPILWECDAQQISQVLTNLLQNAIDSLEAFYKLEKSPSPNGIGAHVRLKVWLTEGGISVSIEDNGPGFPKSGREHLTEPYFTTREKGTGLGLAIVAKIVEDHQGKLFLEDSEELGGALVRLVFALNSKRG